MANKDQVNINVRTKESGGGALDRVVAGLKNIKEHGGAASKAIDGFVGLVSGPFAALAGIAASVAAAFSGVSHAINEFAKAEESVAKLDAALAQNGLLTDEVREKYQELATELANVTAISDDDWLAVLQKLTQFGSKPESIGMDVDAVKNLAGIVGDLGTATTLYSRALQGNYAAFRRYGIVVGEAGTQTEKLKTLQEQLAQRGGGQLEASANSLTGKFRNLKNQIGEVTEGIGQQIAKTFFLGEAADFVAGAFEWWADKLGGTKEKLEGIRNATVDAKAADEAYAAQLSMVAQLSERVTKATTAQTDAIRAKQRAEDEITDAKLALNLAIVDERVASGNLSQSGGIKKRSELRAAASAEKFRREQAADIAALQLNERALADLLKARASLESRKSTLGSEIASGSPLAKLARDRELQVDALQASKDPILRLGIPIELKRKELDEIDRRIVDLRGPAFSIEGKRKEMAAIDQTLGPLNKQIADARSSTLSNNTEIAQRMAAREQVFGINQAREGVAGGNALSAVNSSNAAVVDLSSTFLQIQQAQEKRIRQLEQQAKATLNR